MDVCFNVLIEWSKPVAMKLLLFVCTHNIKTNINTSLFTKFNIIIV